MDDTDPNLEIVDAMHAPLCDASESEINALVDEVLKTGKHLTLPTNDNSAASERFHARAIADQMQRLAHQLGPTPDAIVDGPDDCDEWWFEVDARRLGPISLRKARYLWEDGVLTPDSLCWHEGFSSWVSLFRVSELAEALAPRTASTSERLDAAASVETIPQAAPPSETNWIPNAGASLEAANRERLAASQPRPQPEVQTPPLSLAPSAAPSVAVDDAPTLLHVETIPPAEASADPSPSPKKRRRKNRLMHVIVNGAAKGVAVAAAMVALRFLLPHAGIDTPLVVVMREPQAAAASAAPSAPAPASPALVAAAVSPIKPRKQAEPVRAKHATPAVVPAKTVAHPSKPAAPVKATSASKPEPSSSKPASNEDAFAQEFAPDQDALETSEIFEVVAAHKSEVTDCIREQKAVAPQRSGRLVMRWWVQLDGRVTDVEVRSPDLADQPLAECLRKQIAGWTFPKHEVPHAAIDFPFVF